MRHRVERAFLARIPLSPPLPCLRETLPGGVKGPCRRSSPGGRCSPFLCKRRLSGTRIRGASRQTEFVPLSFQATSSRPYCLCSFATVRVYKTTQLADLLTV